MQKIHADLYKKIYRIRRAEQAIIDHYQEDEMKTPMHMSMGEEAITAGVTLALGNNGQVFGYYRSHALYLSMTDETEQFFAEMYGKVSGMVRGKGGSMHLMAPEKGLLGISAVVASTIAPATGAALANKMKKNGKIVASFFGDGAVEQGVFWESLNAACLMKLPIIFVCEDNGLAVDVPEKERHGFGSISKVVERFHCNVFYSESTDAEELYNLTKKAISSIKKTGKPAFLHLKYSRYLQHIGIKNDFDESVQAGFENIGYRSKKEYDMWLKKDPLKLMRQKLLKGGANERQIELIEQKINKEVEHSIKKAKEASFPKKEELHDNVFSEKS